MTLIIYFDKCRDILNIVSKYQKEEEASVYQIETIEPVSFLAKLKNETVNIKKCNLNLLNYDKIILISSLWHNEVPSPVIRFLEQSTGKIRNITYVLYNKNGEDKPDEFDKMDRILNLRRNKSFFVTLNKKTINVRVYQ
ncbi:MAG: hypothetical protein IJ068_07365 [Bacilli bacterium]|nr:hypothetical protein [Bacilli bacterium]